MLLPPTYLVDHTLRNEAAASYIFLVNRMYFFVVQHRRTKLFIITPFWKCPRVVCTTSVQINLKKPNNFNVVIKPPSQKKIAALCNTNKTNLSFVINHLVAIVVVVVFRFHFLRGFRWLIINRPLASTLSGFYAIS